MTVHPPETLFGVSRALDQQEARSLATVLSAAWRHQAGRSPASLEGDLGYLRRYFAPTATGRRLREAVAALPRGKTPAQPQLPQEVFLVAPSGRGLVTPEGRVLLHILEKHRDENPVAIQTAEVAWAYRAIADLYRQWSRDRLLEALGINEGALRLPVIGFALFLLVNASVGEDHALPIPADEKKEVELRSIIGPVIDAFVESLNPNRKRKETFRLRGGWTVTETTRHLFHFVSCTAESMWIHPSCSKDLVARLGRELARDKKRTALEVENAARELIAAYARFRPALAARGLAYERSANTSAVRQQLLESFEKARAGT